MGRIWDLENHKEKTALLDEFGKSMTYDQLNTEACELAKRIGTRCLVFSLCRNEIGSVLNWFH
jgi:hypothetical protein